MSHQGRLLDAAGTPITGSVQVTFTIYDQASGGTTLWTQGPAGVTCSNGYYSVELASLGSVFDGTPRYLGITVGADPEMTPRSPLLSVPYALSSGNLPDGTGNGQIATWQGGNWIARAPLAPATDSNMQPFQVVNFIIALQGMYPSRSGIANPTLAEITMFGGTFAPRSWALCDGQLLAISSNTALFSLLGTTFGGDGRTTFGLPDLRGRVPVHAGTGPGLSNRRLGASGGSQTTGHTH